MIKIAFCDNDRAFLDSLSALLAQYHPEGNNEIRCTAFQNPEQLLSQVAQGVRFDVVFLETLFPDTTGINVAATLKSYDNTIKIIFLTENAEQAVSSYGVGAFFYQLKPVDKDIFFQLMDSVLSSCETVAAESLVLRCKNGIVRVAIRRIEYCEVIHRTLYIHLTDGQVLECIGSMDHFSAILEPCGCLIRPHRSYLINLNHIQSLTHHIISMSSQAEIPLPRGKYHKILELYLEHTALEGLIIV